VAAIALQEVKHTWVERSSRIGQAY
jgi:hypothetical protein